MPKEQITINGTVWTVPGHVVQDIKRLISPHGEDKKPADAEEKPELAKRLKTSKGKLTLAHKRINELEKELADLKKATTGSSGGGE